jgi:hypothetical protein
VSHTVANVIAIALVSHAASAIAAARRIALVHAEPALVRSVDLALYPWDIEVVEVPDTPPDSDAPDASALAQSIAERHQADAVAWIARGDAPLLWFFDATSASLQSRALPATSGDDAAGYAAVALTLKTFVRATPLEPRLTPAPAPRPASSWETRMEIAGMVRVPLGGAGGEPRIGLWASEWYGTSRVMWGAALGASAGLGMTFDDGVSRGSLEDVDARASLRARVRIAARVAFEPRLGGSAHFERAEVTTTPATLGEARLRVNPSIDAGLFLGWEASDTFAWLIGLEALYSLRYQRWLAGERVVFAPSPLWLQAGTSLVWSFR